MTTRRNMLVLGLLGGTALLAPSRAAFAAGDHSAAEAIAAAILDRYVAAVNAHDTSSFPEIFTESYIQHLGPKSFRPRRHNRGFSPGLRRDA